MEFRKELAETAKRICRPGCGILAADESLGTIGKKFTPLGVENSQENRRAYRELLFTTPDVEKYISGVILFDETARDVTSTGEKMIDVLSKKGIIPGIKVDKGVQPLYGANEGETWTAGLDDLDARCKEYYKMGCRFTKWRSVLKIDTKTNCPSELAMQENAWGLARYAGICQANGLVPIVEPEILADGEHTIETCLKVTERVNQIVFKALTDNNIFFEGMLLKPNMVTPGTKCPTKASPEQIGVMTATALSRSVLPACVGIMFLSGGQSEEEASLNLNALNRLQSIRRPWFLSFSYGRALQNTCVKTWAGKADNWKLAQEKLIQRCQANGQAQLGKYAGSSDPAATESLFVADYKY